jgi:hypothetical protein
MQLEWSTCLGLSQFWCTELLCVSHHWEIWIMKIDWALGADVRVRVSGCH